MSTVREVNGKLVFPPLGALSRIHTHAPQCLCPQCKNRFRECACEFTSKFRAKLEEPPHQARPWGYKGVQVLSVTHPDHPMYGKSAP